MQLPILRVIAEGSNEIGDTFTRLATDLFQTLGYQDLRINIHKSGRELDIEGSHAYERRTLIAECKAQAAPVGGGDINKFVGAVDAERGARLGGAVIQAYYLSLSGYRETALEQERQLNNQRVTLLGNSDIVKRIIESNIVVAPAEAADAARKFIATLKPDLDFRRLELIAHSTGWLWGVYFADANAQSHVCLVHADGQIVTDRLIPQVHIEDSIALTRQTSEPSPQSRYVWQIYNEYLAREYGAITLEGMPVDQEVGSKSFCLEDLYIPIEVEPIVGPAVEEEPREGDGLAEAEEPAVVASSKSVVQRSRVVRQSIGRLLDSEDHISILGPPGSGKSTLIKRLAIAYSDSSRLTAANDDLPTTDWQPIAIRCRHLAGSVTQPIFRILQESINRAEHAELYDAFGTVLGELLRDGRILLLVDGLDEIPAAGARASFVGQLRTFLSRYPHTKLVLTSREVGFRQVAGVVYSMCKAHRVADLSNIDIYRLVSAWHEQIVGSSAEIRAEARRLALSIVSNDRLRRLAVNPLLLTTLLLVKRWVGQLPRKRTVLYQKAIEVLLMTWNVQGHEPIDLEEALPQLGYAAYRMMVAKASSASAAELSELFLDARKDLPELLAYSTVSVQTFLSRVEERSSLLVLSGYRADDAELIPIYEFKHLTFQEYLAALAISNKWLPEDQQTLGLTELLDSVLKDPYWSEVVKIASVLTRREGARVVERLMTLSKRPPNQIGTGANVACMNLIGCLGDDVPLSPRLAESAIDVALRNESTLRHRADSDLCSAVAGGRYYELLRHLVFERIQSESAVYPYVRTIQRMAEIDTEGFRNDPDALVSSIRTSIRSRDFSERVRGAARLMTASYFSSNSPLRSGTRASEFPVVALGRLRYSLDFIARDFVLHRDETRPALAWTQLWALAWGARGLSKSPKRVSELRAAILDEWMERDRSWQHYCGWTLGELPLVGTCTPDHSQVAVKRFLVSRWKDPKLDPFVWRGVLATGHFLGFVWSSDTLVRMTLTSLRSGTPRGGRQEDQLAFAMSFLPLLGDAGKLALNDPVFAQLYRRR
jgi:energy-coupling factor transporter ATP-binding protein EcfA2